MVSPAFRKLFRTVAMVQATQGLTAGLYIFTYGALFYDGYRKVGGDEAAMRFASLLMAISMGAEALLEIPTGAFGDTFGRRRTIVSSLSLRGMFCALLAIFPFLVTRESLAVVGVAASLLFALSYTLFSGTFSAWCVDTLKQVDPEAKADALFSRSYSVFFVAQLFGGVAAVLFYVNGLATVGFATGAAACFVCALFCRLLMGEQKRPRKADTGGFRALIDTVRTSFHVFRKSRELLALSFVFAAYLAMLNIVDYLWPVYLKSRTPLADRTSTWTLTVMVVLAACASGAKVLQLFSSRNKTNADARLRNLYYTCALLSSLPLLALAYLNLRGIDTFYAFLLCLAPSMVSYGVIAPLFETLVNNRIPDDHASERSTILSFGNFLRSVLLIALAVPAGGVTGASSPGGWALLAALVAVGAVLGWAFGERHAKTR